MTKAMAIEVKVMALRFPTDINAKGRPIKTMIKLRNGKVIF